MKNIFLVLLLAVGFVHNTNAQYNFNFKQKLTPPDIDSARVASDQFGYSVAIDGNYAVVGARFQSYDSLGNQITLDPGAAYIYEKNPSGLWTLVKKITPPTPEGFGKFGFAVGISGNHIIVSAYDYSTDSLGGNFKSGAGAAYIYENRNGVWGYAEKISAPDVNNGRKEQDLFGISVAISGTYAIVGAMYHSYDSSGGDSVFRAGAAYIYEKNNGAWGFVKKITPPTTNNGRKAEDQFGRVVSISGNYALVGSERHSYDSVGNDSLQWSGAAYIFERNNGAWGFVKKLSHPKTTSPQRQRDFFGSSVALNGDFAIVGARGDKFDSIGGSFSDKAGAAFIYKRINGSWSLQEKITAPSIDSNRIDSDFFGAAVDIDDNFIVVGARNHSYDSTGTNKKSKAGALYIFENRNNSWNYLKKLSAPESNNYRNRDDWLGFSVGISDTVVISGAYFHDYDSSGTNFKDNAGAAFIFGWGLNNTVDTLSSFVISKPDSMESFELGGDSSTLPQLLFTWEKSVPKTGINPPTYTVAFDTAGSATPFNTFNAGTDTFYVLSYADARAFFNNYKTNNILNANWYVIAEANGFSRQSDNKHAITFYDSSSTVGLSELTTLLRLYPNPTSSHLNIEFPKGILGIKLHTISGQKVFDKPYDAISEVAINLSGFKTGIYLIEVNTTMGIVFKRIEVSSK